MGMNRVLVIIVTVFGLTGEFNYLNNVNVVHCLKCNSFFHFYFTNCFVYIGYGFNNIK